MLDSLTFIVLVFHFCPIYLKKIWNPFTTHGTWTKKTKKKKSKKRYRERVGRKKERRRRKKEEEGEQRKLTCTWLWSYGGDWFFFFSFSVIYSCRLKLVYQPKLAGMTETQECRFSILEMHSKECRMHSQEFIR